MGGDKEKRFKLNFKRQKEIEGHPFSTTKDMLNFFYNVVYQEGELHIFKVFRSNGRIEGLGVIMLMVS